MEGRGRACSLFLMLLVLSFGSMMGGEMGGLRRSSWARFTGRLFILWRWVRGVATLTAVLA